jgi:hypothetical protein
MPRAIETEIPAHFRRVHFFAAMGPTGHTRHNWNSRPVNMPMAQEPPTHAPSPEEAAQLFAYIREELARTPANGAAGPDIDSLQAIADGLPEPFRGNAQNAIAASVLLGAQGGPLVGDAGGRSRATLEAWLDAATAGLCEEARRRIAAAMVEEIVPAIEARVEDGTPPEEAESACLAALGSPAEARARFLRENLSAEEDAWLERLRTGRVPEGASALQTILTGPVAALAVLLAGVTGLWLTISPRPWGQVLWGPALMLCLLSAPELAAPWLHRRLRPRSPREFLCIIGALQAAICLALFLLNAAVARYMLAPAQAEAFARGESIAINALFFAAGLLFPLATWRTLKKLPRG